MTGLPSRRDQLRCVLLRALYTCIFFFNDTATAEIYTLSLHDALPIAAGHGFARIGSGPSGETAFRPPGYPYLLAGVYSLSGVERAKTSTRLLAGRVANALVGAAIVALIGVLSAQLFDRRVALVAMALGAVYLPLILV